MKTNFVSKTVLSAIAACLMYFVAQDAFNARNRARSRDRRRP